MASHDVVVPIKQSDGSYREPRSSPFSPRSLRTLGLLLGGLVYFGVCVWLAEVSIVNLIKGVPVMGRWAAGAWPPFYEDFHIMLLRAVETLAIATIGTAVATVIAFPLSILISANTTPSPIVAYPVRWFANICRAIDTVVFALLFVAAVGLGPFAGVLGMIVHASGVMAKLNSEAIETIPNAPLEAAAMTGANRTKIVTFALLPSVMPSLGSVSLYVWEANVRISTVLGVVGAGGIGGEIRAAMDLLDFPRLFTLTVIVIIMVIVIDQFSAWLRSKLI
ncbi:MAG: phosphonate ABC transporter, permease protein PhnE [Acidimicrobiia bacterium]|nr:phosphonate ABC transporter, permease protein PhnE [Acidimicrobiia bacterium]